MTTSILDLAAGLPGHDADEVVAVARSVVPAIETLDAERQWRELRIAAATIDAWEQNGTGLLARRLGEAERQRRLLGGDHA
jgi:hypothetical protein